MLKNRAAFVLVGRGRCGYERKVREMQCCNAAGFEDGGRWLQAKECGSPLEAGKGKEIGFTLESLSTKEHSPVDILILVQ